MATIPQESSHWQLVNEQKWLRSNKTLFITTGAWLDMAHGLRLLGPVLEDAFFSHIVSPHLFSTVRCQEPVLTGINLAPAGNTLIFFCPH